MKKTQFCILVRVAVALAVVIFFGTGTAFAEPSSGEPVIVKGGPGLPADITVSEAAKMRADGALLLDVREVSEWEEFHIPGSTLIPLGQLAARAGELPRDRDIVVVCRTGNRSRKGRDILKKAGIGRVTNMEGGVTRWRSEGLPVTTGR